MSTTPTRKGSRAAHQPLHRRRWVQVALVSVLGGMLCIATGLSDNLHFLPWVIAALPVFAVLIRYQTTVRANQIGRGPVHWLGKWGVLNLVLWMMLQFAVGYFAASRESRAKSEANRLRHYVTEMSEWKMLIEGRQGRVQDLTSYIHKLLSGIKYSLKKVTAECRALARLAGQPGQSKETARRIDQVKYFTNNFVNRMSSFTIQMRDKWWDQDWLDHHEVRIGGITIAQNLMVPTLRDGITDRLKGIPGLCGNSNATMLLREEAEWIETTPDLCASIILEILSGTVRSMTVPVPLPEPPR